MRTDKRMAQEMLTVAKLHFAEGSIKDALKAIEECVKQTTRPGTRLQAARLLIEHERDLHKFENPQKQTMVHEFPTELRIRGVEPGEVLKEEENNNE